LAIFSRFRALHAVGEPAVDLDEQLVDERLGGHLLEHAAVRVDEADVAAAGDPEVRVARLARPVHGTAHDGDLERLGIRPQPVLDDAREVLDADVVTAARRARDHDGPALTQPERLQDLPGDLDLLHGVGGQGDAQRVSDPVCEQRSDPDGALDRTGELRSGLRDTEVQRVRHLRREHPVRADHRRHVRGLHGDLELAVLELLEELHFLEGRRDERLRLVLLRERLEVLRQRARVGTDPHRDPRVLGRLHHLLDLIGAADVPGVDAHGCDACLDRLERERGVEVDVCDDRKR
jgi:hypothetical protein